MMDAILELLNIAKRKHFNAKKQSCLDMLIGVLTLIFFICI